MWKPAIIAIVFGFFVAASALGAPHGAVITDSFDVATQAPSTQPPEQDHSQHESSTPQVSPQSKPGMMQGMMERHQQMMSEMAAADAKLEALVKDMNSAVGQAKLDVMAQVLNELMLQGRAMRQHMGMCGGMKHSQ